MLTLEEIENISFHKSSMGGYKRDEIDNFVDKVIKKVKTLENENRELESRIELLNKQIQEYKENEDTVQSAIITAQMTAKQIVMEATEKSDKQLSESKEEAEKLLSESKKKSEEILTEAKEKAERLNAEADAEIEEKVNKALRESSDKIDENNRIIDVQKKNIIKLMGEANNFRNSLLRAYKDHLNVINAMAKGEDFKKQQKELEHNYPQINGNKPVYTASKEILPPVSDDTGTDISSGEETAPDTNTDISSGKETVSDTETDNKPEEMVYPDANKKAEEVKTEEQNTENEVQIKRQPVFVSSPDSKENHIKKK